MKKLCSFFFILFLLLVFSCTGEPPELREVYSEAGWWLDNDTGRIHAFLGVFAKVYDEDGQKDIKQIHVIHDQSSLIWTMSEESWTQYREGESLWLGSSLLRLPVSNKSLPSGDYRVLVEEDSGNSVEEKFFLKKMKLPDKTGFPGITKETSRYVFDGNTELRVYDNNGNQLKILTKSPVEKNQFPKNAEVCFAADTSGDVTLIQGPFYLFQEGSDRNN